MIVDTHVHFWRWPSAPEAAAQAREFAERLPSSHASGPFGLEDLIATMDAHGVGMSIQITPTLMGFDNSDSLAGAREHPSRFRVMVRCDPRARDLADQLDAIRADPLVAGIRVNQLPFDGPWLVDGTLEPLFALAQEREIPIALYAPWRHHDIADLARRYPNLALLVDHAAVNVLGETDAPTRFNGWEELPVLAAQQNVVIKMSGLLEATDEGAERRESTRRFRQLYELFGAGRLLWGSNYPVASRVATYQQTLDLVAGSEFLSAPDKAAILGGNAEAMFGLRRHVPSDQSRMGDAKCST